jgi:hypothetical protein
MKKQIVVAPTITGLSRDETIRIEALRATAPIIAAVVTDRTPEPQLVEFFVRVVNRFELYIKYGNPGDSRVAGAGSIGDDRDDVDKGYRF